MGEGGTRWSKWATFSVWGNTISDGYINLYSFDLGPNGDIATFTNGVAPYTSPVGYVPPNGYGLYDMAENVYEFCWDWHHISTRHPFFF